MMCLTISHMGALSLQIVMDIHRFASIVLIFEIIQVNAKQLFVILIPMVITVTIVSYLTFLLHHIPIERHHCCHISTFLLVFAQLFIHQQFLNDEIYLHWNYSSDIIVLIFILPCTYHFVILWMVNTTREKTCRHALDIRYKVRIFFISTMPILFMAI